MRKSKTPHNLTLLFLLTLLLLHLPFEISGCGMVVHIDLTSRALNSFKPDSTYPYVANLQRYQSYFVAGAPFPDWGYLCNNPAGEATHWTPFINAAKAYLEKTYAPGTDSYNKLMAFIFGV